jgi:hypothetical protein
MFKSVEEKEAERREREAALAAADQQRAAQQVERERQAFLASPVGRAGAARQAGDRFFELQLKVAAQTGQASFGSTTTQGSVTSPTTVLAEVEALGWRLEHVSYFFVPTGESSTERVFLSGQNVAVEGLTMGAYLFRNTEAPASG